MARATAQHIAVRGSLNFAKFLHPADALKRSKKLNKTFGKMIKLKAKGK
jgi:hypothetical protein